ncbi:probable WRKY transcription factor 75 [Cynara cardunculus var. scolymus]|nr:probable WRKY transcription factor 75 [Cynara cardunculus var. scolymus]
MKNYATLFPSSSTSTSTSVSSHLSLSLMNDYSPLAYTNDSYDHDQLPLFEKSLNCSSDQEIVVVSPTTSSGLGNSTSGSGKISVKKGEKKIKKPKCAFQTRSQVDILDDGYRWRKYGQKAVKNNKFPRSYYRCTHHGCNVKKQVQRLSKDEGVVVTTYEGTHSHPIEKSTDNFEHILTQMQIYSSC